MSETSPAPSDPSPTATESSRPPVRSDAGTDGDTSSKAREIDASSEARFTHRTLIVVAIVVAAGLLVYILATASYAFFLIFAGLVLAAVFCGLASALRKIGVPRTVGLIAIYVGLILLLAAGAAWGGIALVSQIGDLPRMVNAQIDRLPEALQQLGIPVGNDIGTDALRRYLPDVSGLFSSASKTAYSVLGAVGNALIVLFIAIFVSFQPGMYRRGIVSLFTRNQRDRIDQALSDSASELILWLAGQGISMTTIFVVSLIGLYAIGMPNAFLLALQAGLLCFIPTLGAVVAGVIIVFAGFAESPQMALYGLLVYTVIQAVESNVAQPIAQRYTSALPPALTLGAQLVFGVLFGLVGVALVVPFIAVVKNLVDELYIRDTLGGPYEGRPQGDEARPSAASETSRRSSPDAPAATGAPSGDEP